MTEEEDMVRLIGYGRTDLSSDTHTSRSAAVLLPLVVADCGHVEGGQWGGTEEGHEAWAVSVQSVAVRLATPLGHIKKKKRGAGLARPRHSLVSYFFGRRRAGQHGGLE